MSHTSDSVAVRALAPASVAKHHPKENNGETHKERLSARRTAKTVLYNAAGAAICRVIIGIFKLLAKKGPTKVFLQRLPGEVLSLNPLKWAAIFGGFSSLRFVAQAISRGGRYVRMPQKLATLIAGFVCATPVFVMNKSTQTEMCLYAFVRAMHTFSLRFVFPRLPPVLQRFQHYDVLLMCISAMQITYGCLFAPSTMPKSYQKFLGKASMLDERLMRGHSGLMRGLISPEFADYCADNNLGPFDAQSPTVGQQVCDHVHPGQSCNGYALAFIPRNMVYMGIPLYSQLRVAVILTTQRKKLMSHPTKTIVREVKSVLTSSLFLALYVACIIRSSCFGLRRGDRGGVRLALVCFCAGLPTLLEPKNRRMDLALYCAMYAIRSFLLTQYRLGRLPYPRHWFVLLTYFASVCFLFLQYEEDPQLLNSRARHILRFLLRERASDKAGGHVKARSPAPTKVATAAPQKS